MNRRQKSETRRGAAVGAAPAGREAIGESQDYLQMLAAAGEIFWYLIDLYQLSRLARKLLNVLQFVGVCTFRHARADRQALAPEAHGLGFACRRDEIEGLPS